MSDKTSQPAVPLDAPPEYSLTSSSATERRKSPTSSLISKLKSKVSSPEKEAERLAKKEERAKNERETQARLHRMAEAIRIANKTGIPQWVDTDDDGRRQFVEGPLGPPKDWVYENGAYNIRTGSGTTVDGKSEMCQLAGSVPSWT